MLLTFSILLFLNQTGRKRVELFCYNTMTLKLLTLNIYLLGILRIILGVIVSLSLKLPKSIYKAKYFKNHISNSYGQVLNKVSKYNLAIQKPWILLLKKWILLIKSPAKSADKEMKYHFDECDFISSSDDV